MKRCQRHLYRLTKAKHCKSEVLVYKPLAAVGCGLKAHELKGLEYQPKQMNRGCLINLFGNVQCGGACRGVVAGG